jgi:hypothetical protein
VIQVELDGNRDGSAGGDFHSYFFTTVEVEDVAAPSVEVEDSRIPGT